MHARRLVLDITRQPVLPCSLPPRKLGWLSAECALSLPSVLQCLHTKLSSWLHADFDPDLPEKPNELPLVRNCASGSWCCDQDGALGQECCLNRRGAFLNDSRLPLACTGHADIAARLEGKVVSREGGSRESASSWTAPISSPTGLIPTPVVAGTAAITGSGESITLTTSNASLTPTAAPASTSNLLPASFPTSSSLPSGLSTGTVAGISVAVVVGIVGGLAALACIVVRRRREMQKRKQGHEKDANLFEAQPQTPRPELGIKSPKYLPAGSSSVAGLRIMSTAPGRPSGRGLSPQRPPSHELPLCLPKAADRTLGPNTGMSQSPSHELSAVPPPPPKYTISDPRAHLAYELDSHNPSRDVSPASRMTSEKDPGSLLGYYTG